MARMVATKAALSIRVDALTDADGKSEADAPTIGLENRAKLESRLRALEHQGDLAGTRRFAADGARKQARYEPASETRTYNTAADLVPTQRDPMETAVQAVLDVKEEKKRAKEERRAKRRAEKEKGKQAAGSDEETNGMDVDEEDEDETTEKKRKRRESEAANGDVEMAVSLPTYFYCPTLLNAALCRLRRPRRSVRQGRRLAKRRRRRKLLLPPMLRAYLQQQMVRERRRKRRRRSHRFLPSFVLPNVLYHFLLLAYSICAPPMGYGMTFTWPKGTLNMTAVQ